jgi:hypothetical protein
MTDGLRGRIVAVEKAEVATTVLEAAELLNDLQPRVGDGPGRRLGL